jgi:hypothetical protein
MAVTRLLSEFKFISEILVKFEQPQFFKPLVQVHF